jgi:hypothetical protein
MCMQLSKIGLIGLNLQDMHIIHMLQRGGSWGCFGCFGRKQNANEIYTNFAKNLLLSSTERGSVTENPMQLGIVLDFFLNPENSENFPKAKFALNLGIRTGKGLKSLKLENPNWPKPKIT